MKTLLLHVANQASPSSLAFHPLGVMAIAGWIQRAGLAETEIRDLQLDFRRKNGEIDSEDFLAFLQLSMPDVVGVSFGTSEFEDAAEVCRLVKSLSKTCVVVAGGIHPTVDPVGTLKEIPQIDYVVKGEGEVVFENLLRALQRSEDPTWIRGVCFRAGGSYINNPRERPLDDLDQLPLTDWGLHGGRYGQQKGQNVYVMSRRGCPYSCTYCATPGTWGTKTRAMTAKRLGDEISALINSIDQFFLMFGDDTFTLDRERTLEICAEMKRRNFDIQWGCQTRADTVDEELLAKMKEAGCIEVNFGVESASDWIRNEMYKKRLDLAAVHQANCAAKEVGMRVCMNFILGPYDNVETIRLLRDFLVTELPDFVQINTLIVFPGLGILHRLNRDGLLKEIIPGRKLAYRIEDPLMQRLFRQVYEIKWFFADLLDINGEILFCDQDKLTEFARISTTYTLIRYFDAFLKNDLASIHSLCEVVTNELTTRKLIARKLPLPNLFVEDGSSVYWGGPHMGEPLQD